mgnify:CR=1 FL=1
MSIFVNTSQEEAFHFVMDYFTGRRMKVLTSNSPSYIRAEFGSWTSISPSNEKGVVEVSVMKRNGGSYVNLNFNFFETYLMALIVTIIGAFATYGFMWWLVVVNPLQRAIVPSGANFLILMPIALFCALMIAVLGYTVSLTRRRFIEEFNMFMQSLHAKKD